MNIPTQTDFDLIIVGGGMVGAALACDCRGLGLSIAVIDPHPPARDWPSGSVDLRVSALNRASEHLLRRLGAWERMRTIGISPYREMVVWEGAGHGGLHFDSADLGEPDLGHIVENRVTRLALWELLEQAIDIELFCPNTLGSIDSEAHPVRVRLGDGRTLTAHLLVGADGRDSRVRTALGINSKAALYGQQAIVATVEPEHWHRETAWQRFLPTGPLAFLPLADGRCSIVWSAESQLADRLLALDDAAFISELEQAFDRRLGRIRTIGARAAFPLRRSLALSYIRPRAALIGDAAHAIHPLAGQGVNLGFMDAAALAAAIRHARQRRRHIGGVATLRRYERARRCDNRRMLTAMDLIHRVFSNDQPLLAIARGLGLSAVDLLGPVKRQLMREAMGLSDDTPISPAGISAPK